MSDELLAARRAKLDALRAAGIEPFPHQFAGAEPVARVREAHGNLQPGEETDSSHRVAGRLAARRGQGKMAFLDLVDRSGRIQLQARVDELGEERLGGLLELDLGDLIGVDGVAFASRRGELTLRLTDFTVLAKSLQAPAGKASRSPGRRDALSPSRARPDLERGGTRALHHARAGDQRRPRVP